MGVNGAPETKTTLGIDRVYVRLAIVGTLIVACFVALFSRLWFLQVLAAEDYRRLAKENRVRLVHSEPPRGRILARDGEVLVTNRATLAITVDRQVVRSRRKERRVLGRLARVLDVGQRELRVNLHDAAASPYKPVVVATDVPERKMYWILEHKERFPGVDKLSLPLRRFPEGDTAAHILGYVGEIFPEDLRSDHFKNAQPRYAPGDLVGKAGLEYHYDRVLRGTPEVRRVVVNSAGRVINRWRIRAEQPGDDLVLALDLDVQRLVERALASGIAAARGAGYLAPAGGVVVMDPGNGEVLGMSSYPTFNPSLLADGITSKELRRLEGVEENPDDDALLNRAIQAPVPSGSTFKVVTAGAALWTGVATPYTYLDCPGSIVLPPEGGPGSVVFPNWTSADLGLMGFPESLEVSCDTFYYQLGWSLEERFGVGLASGDESERFQDYIRKAGFDSPTGVDLRNESSGLIPDEQWCDELNEADPTSCVGGWLPGYTVNLAIGQGDMLVTPMQMAVSYAAIANGGRIVEPRLGMAVSRTNEAGEQETRELDTKVRRRLPLDATELAGIEQGLVDVVSGDQGTAAAAFAGFPSSEYPIAGKTGTAQIGETDLNRAWFIAYGPVGDPRYVVAVYLEKAGHGGESAAPVAREIFEGLFGIDKETDVQLGQDASG
jgi:penicillin-binding protein 2